MNSLTQSPGQTAHYGLKFFTLGELLAEKLPPRQALLDGLLRDGESLMLWAPTGVGKTMAALSMALAMAGGGQFLGWKATKHRRVLYVDGEMHTGDLQDRLKTLPMAIPGLDREAVDKNLSIYARHAQEPGEPFPDLCHHDGADFILNKAIEDQFEVVILDNLSVLATISDENSASAMDPVLDLLMRLKQANIATILLHHSGKGGENFRGSSKLSTTFEVILGLKATTGTSPKALAAFDMEFSKFRAVRNGTIRPTTAWLEADDKGVLSWRYEASKDDRLKRVVEEVLSGKYRTQEDLARALGVSAGTLSNLKAKALRTGLITGDAWKAAFRTASADLLSVAESGEPADVAVH